MVEYTVNNQMCEDCHRTEAKDYWRTCVSFLTERRNLNVNGFLIHIVVSYRCKSGRE